MVTRLLQLAEVPDRPTPPTRSRSRCATGGGPARRRRCRAAGHAARLRAAVAPARGGHRGRGGQGGGEVIGSVRGTVLERTAAGEVLVEVGGVGYRVLVPAGALPALHPGDAAFLFTHLHVREDAMVLYGFPTRDERDTFEALIGATGVGPEARAGDAVGALADGAAPGAGRRRPRRAHARARRRQAHRAAAARRAQGPPRRPRRRPHRAAARRRRRAPRCATRSPGSATRPTRCATSSRSCPTTAR